MFYKHSKLIELSPQLNLVYPQRTIVPYTILYSVILRTIYEFSGTDRNIPRRPSFLKNNQLPNTLQRQIYLFHSLTRPLKNRSKNVKPTHLFQEQFTYSWVFPLLIFWASLRNCLWHLQLLTWTIVKISNPETASILTSQPKEILTAVVVGRAKTHQLTLTNMTSNN